MRKIRNVFKLTIVLIFATVTSGNVYALGPVQPSNDDILTSVNNSNIVYEEVIASGKLEPTYVIRNTRGLTPDVEVVYTAVTIVKDHNKNIIPGGRHSLTAKFVGGNPVAHEATRNGAVEEWMSGKTTIDVMYLNGINRSYVMSTLTAQYGSSFTVQKIRLYNDGYWYVTQSYYNDDW